MVVALCKFAVVGIATASAIRTTRTTVNSFIRFIVLFDGVFVDLAILHDDNEVLVGICNEVEILQRIAVHQVQVVKCAFLHHTELARDRGRAGR